MTRRRGMRRAPGPGPEPPRATAGRARSACGQSSVEVVALLPLLLALALGAGQLLAAGAARETAERAATAGAMAVLQGRDPEAEARAAAPSWPRGRLVVRRDGGRLSVIATPRSVLPGLSTLLTATARADAGPGR